MLKYYCYISRNKIDTLYMQTDEGNIETSGLSKEIDVNISAETPKDKFSVLSLIGTDLSFGANGLLQFNKTIKTQYSKKLNTVIRELGKSNLIQPLLPLTSPKELKPIYYYYKGKFHISDSPNLEIDTNYVDGFANIESIVEGTDRIKISLTCSMKYFSDTREGGKYMIHSSNYHFFKTKTELDFDTVFIFTGYDEKTKTILGSPLFLALDQQGGNHL